MASKKQSGLLPINDYSSRGDVEVIPKKSLPTENPAFLKDGVVGVETNHSSLKWSVAPTAPGQEEPAEGAQYNDDEVNDPSQGPLDPGGYDPNMSGPRPTEQAVDWKAGAWSPWNENDDYREFTWDTQNAAESRLTAGFAIKTGYAAYDPDYDSNGGMPTPPRLNSSQEQEYEFGNDKTEPQGDFSGTPETISGIAVSPVVRRK